MSASPQRRRGPIRFRVVPSEEGTMLGHLLAKRLPNTDVERGREIVRAGGAYMGHLRVRVPTARVAPGERITVYPEAAEVEEMRPQDVRIVYRDEDFVVLDKPTGVPVGATKACARGTLAEGLRRVLEKEGVLRPYVGIVHRLDQGASGLVLMTIRGVANRSVHKQFVDHSIARNYVARVHGEFPETATCELAIVETADGGARVDPDHRRAKPARTDFRRRAVLGDQSVVDVQLTTGRMHQIRVHAAALGHPIVGDRRYGRESPDVDDAPRLLLHAWQLELSHPVRGDPIRIETELPSWASGDLVS